MNIIPRLQYTISSPVSADEAYQIASGAYVILSGRSYRVREIEAKEKWFLSFYPERRRAQLQNPFLPIIWVSFSATAHGTDIILDVKLRSRIRTILLYVLFVSLLFTAVLLLLFLFRRTFPVLCVFFPLTVSFAVYLITILVFFILSKSVLKQFNDEFGYYI